MIKLGEIAEVYSGYAFQSKDLSDDVSGIPVIKIGNIIGNEIDYTHTQFISSDLVSKRMESFYLQDKDILIAMTGQGSVGRVGQLRKKKKNDCLLLNQRVGRFVVNEDKYDRDFLFYVLSSDNYQRLLFSLGSGSGQPNLSPTIIKDVDIPLLPIETQKKISAILSSIDDKININKKKNSILQEQARALYKNWFIDYGPFGGICPDNWSSGKLKDVLALKRNPIKAGENTALPYLPIDVIPMNSFSIIEAKPNYEAQSSLVTFNKDDILIGAMRVYFHRVVIAPFDGITRTTCFTLVPIDPDYLAFGLLCCDLDSSIDYAQSTSKGSTMPYAVWEGGFGDMEIIIPDKAIAHEFNTLVMPLLRTIQSSFAENTNLREIRDYLIPHLMSGEIDVSDVAF